MQFPSENEEVFMPSIGATPDSSVVGSHVAITHIPELNKLLRKRISYNHRIDELAYSIENDFKSPKIEKRKKEKIKFETKGKKIDVKVNELLTKKSKGSSKFYYLFFF